MSYILQMTQKPIATIGSENATNMVRDRKRNICLAIILFTLTLTSCSTINIETISTQQCNLTITHHSEGTTYSLSNECTIHINTEHSEANDV